MFWDNWHCTLTSVHNRNNYDYRWWLTPCRADYPLFWFQIVKWFGQLLVRLASSSSCDSSPVVSFEKILISIVIVNPQPRRNLESMSFPTFLNSQMTGHFRRREKRCETTQTTAAKWIWKMRKTRSRTCMHNIILISVKDVWQFVSECFHIS